MLLFRSVWPLTKLFPPDSPARARKNGRILSDPHRVSHKTKIQNSIYIKFFFKSTDVPLILDETFAELHLDGMIRTGWVIGMDFWVEERGLDSTPPPGNRVTAVRKGLSELWK